jgi:hypothetical protein
MILKSDFVKVIFASAGASDIRYKGAGGKKKQGFVARYLLAWVWLLASRTADPRSPIKTPEGGG